MRVSKHYCKYIFTFLQPPKDWHLVVIVASTTGLSVILLLLKTFLPDFRFKPTMVQLTLVTSATTF